mmetsp:Transcript_12952/g.35522  ORF Transcript_12952/g.35522 Transcript_12952/m.35522 type:complete len:236 (+) Transcript_12952:986-1693(+)
MSCESWSPRSFGASTAPPAPPPPTTTTPAAVGTGPVETRTGKTAGTCTTATAAAAGAAGRAASRATVAEVEGNGFRATRPRCRSTNGRPRARVAVTCSFTRQSKECQIQMLQSSTLAPPPTGSARTATSPTRRAAASPRRSAPTPTLAMTASSCRPSSSAASPDLPPPSRRRHPQLRPRPRPVPHRRPARPNPGAATDLHQHRAARNRAAFGRWAWWSRQALALRRRSRPRESTS